MSLTTEFVPLELDQLRREAAVLKADGWRFIQTHAVYTDNGVDLYYSFMKDGKAVNYWVQGVQKGTPVPSITDLFLAAFVFENEARELFGVNMQGIAIDFAGAMYAPAVSEPMTIISPEQKAARDKARKAAEAAARKAAQEPAAESESQGSGSGAALGGVKRIFVMTPERQARLDAKLPTLSDEKKAKVEAALKARAVEAQAAASQGDGAPATANAEEPAKPAQAEPAKAAQPQPVAGSKLVPAAAAVDHVLDAALAALDGDKAAKVRAALSGEAVAATTSDGAAAEAPVPAGVISDVQVAHLVEGMDDAKAAIVRAALAAKGGE